MRVVVPESLWVGHALDIRENPTRLFDKKIGAIVDIAYNEPVANVPRQLIYCRFPLVDGGGNSNSILRSAIETVVRFLREEIPLIVACSAGMSRAPTVAAMGLAVYENRDPVEVLLEIQAGNPECGIEPLGLEVHPLLWKSALAVVAEIR